MPQVFQVLKCYKCLTFQVHQTKKSNKFQCKMCGEKQSIKRHYGLGNGQECRKHVQKLNGFRGELDESKSSCNETDDDEVDVFSQPKPEPHVPSKQQIKNSKWTNFIDTEEVVDVPCSNDTMYLNNTEVVLELPRKCKKISGKKSQSTTNGDEEASNENLMNSLHKPQDKDKKSFINLTTLTKSIEIDKGQFDSLIYRHTVMKESKPCQSKWSNDDIRDTNITDLNKNSKNDFSIKYKNIVPLTLNKTSKWAKFADEEDHEIMSDVCKKTNDKLINDGCAYRANEDTFEAYGKSCLPVVPVSQLKHSSNENSESINTVMDKSKKPQSLFSLCNDDIDDYLTI